MWRMVHLPKIIMGFDGGSMFLHVGNDVVVHHPDVIGIFDLENTSYLRAKQRDNRVIDVTQDIPKSFVVTCDKKGQEKVYLSLLAPRTLKKRWEEIE